MKTLTRKWMAAALLALAPAASGWAQRHTVCLKPSAADGQDAQLYNFYGCTPAGWSGLPENTNYGFETAFRYDDWTYTTAGCSEGTGRGLIKFDGLDALLNALPPFSVLTGAELKLYGIDSYGGSGTYTTSYPLGVAAPYNEGLIYRVDPSTPWTQSTVTWNNFNAAPTWGGTPSVISASPSPNNMWNWNTSVSVLPQVSAIWQDLQAGVPAANQGFLLILADESHDRRAEFATSDHPDPARWPELCITYEVRNPCDFTYCTRSDAPLTVEFTGANGDPSYNGYCRWYFDGVYISDHISVFHTFSQPGTHTVELAVIDRRGRTICKHEQQICIAPPASNPRPPYWCGPDFSVCANTATPGVYTFTALQNGNQAQQFQWTTPAGNFNGPSITIPVSSGTVRLLAIYYAPYFSKCYADMDFCAYFRPAGTETTTAVSNVAGAGSDFTVSAAPNPVHDVLHVQYGLPGSGAAHITVTDALGRTVWSQQTTLPKGTGTLAVPFADLPAGLYLLKMESGNEVRTLKVSKAP